MFCASRSMSRLGGGSITAAHGDDIWCTSRSASELLMLLTGFEISCGTHNHLSSVLRQAVVGSLLSTWACGVCAAGFHGLLLLLFLECKMLLAHTRHACAKGPALANNKVISWSKPHTVACARACLIGVRSWNVRHVAELKSLRQYVA